MTIERVKCSSCDNMILPRTAERNDGLCAPCAKTSQKDRNEIKNKRAELISFFNDNKPRALSSLSPIIIQDIQSYGFAQKGTQIETEAYYKIGCKCGSMNFLIKGRYENVPGYKEQCLFSPILLSCSKCSVNEVIFDANIHGYNAEYDQDSPQSIDKQTNSYACPSCNNDHFEVITHHHYPDDLFSEEFSDFKVRLQDLFDSISIYGLCTKCSKLSSATDFECA